MYYIISHIDPLYMYINLNLYLHKLYFYNNYIFSKLNNNSEILLLVKDLLLLFWKLYNKIKKDNVYLYLFFTIFYCSETLELCYAFKHLELI